MKYNIYDIEGDVVKDDDTYLIKDNKTLNNLVLSSTDLKPGKSTRGHSHPGQEEIYYFVSGTGEMELGDQKFNVQGSDVVIVPDGAFHRVHNTAKHSTLYFVCVFDGKREH